MNPTATMAQFGTLHNVEYVHRHCDECARGVNPATGLMYCGLGEAGVPHGVVKDVFQENALGTFLLKAGLLSPHWINAWYASILAPFMGSWGSRKLFRNLITNAGLAGIAGRTNGYGSPAAFTYIAVGTGTTAAAATDTALQTEITGSGMARANSTVSLVTTTVSNDTAQMSNTFSVTGTAAVTESGVLNASSAGTLLCHQVFSAINVQSGDSLQVTWKVQASA